MRLLKFTVIAALASSASFAQQRALTHDDYDQWNSIRTTDITHDGSYIAVQTSPQEGDSYVELIKVRNASRIRLERTSNPQFTSDGRWLFATVKPAYDQVRQLKLKDTPKDEMPKNQLIRVNVNSQVIDTVHNVVRFKVNEYSGSLVAIAIEDDPEPEEEPTDSTESTEEETDFILDGDEEHGSGFYSDKAKRWVIWNLSSNQKDTIHRVTDFDWADEGYVGAGIQSAGDTTQPSTFFSYDPRLEEPFVILDTVFEDIPQYALDLTGDHIVWLKTLDSAEADIQLHSLHATQGEQIVEIVSMDDIHLEEGWMLSPHVSLRFSEATGSVYFGTMPLPFVPEEDTTVLDEEKVSLDIWSWRDEEIQPMQKVNASSDEKASYLAVIHLASDGNYAHMIQLEDEDLENISISESSTRMWAVGYQVPHEERASLSWNYPTKRDFYLVNVTTGERQVIAKGVRSWPSLSPAERFAYWWDGASKQWKGYDIEKNQPLILSANISLPVHQEDHDTPNEPGSYGIGGWTENDETVIIYDKFDLWEVHPGGSAQNITMGKGREMNAIHRIVSLEDEPHLQAGEWILARTDLDDMSTAYVEYELEDGEMNYEELVGGDYKLSRLSKADSSDVYFFRKESIAQYPEIHAVRGDDLADAVALTETNPQQADYRWGTSELVEWTTPKGVELKGLLLKPSDFDPSKQYPVLVYFYEKYSDQLHRYWSPAPSASVINFPYYLSNEYIIFIPDIVYEEGYPGRSAEECILSGAEMIAEYPWADASNMAIQGQSWGGYQVAHLVTRTDMFKCAMAGAPVSNMTSAYGGIRWGSGMSREFQYERTQSRIGGTLWERTDLYLENSPVFYAPQVNTPLLMMHNDGDGAVPWYQGIEYFMALRRLQKPVWMLVYNGEEHNLMQRHNRMDLSIRMSQFFHHYLKGEPAPEWMVNGRPYLEKDYNAATELINETE